MNFINKNRNLEINENPQCLYQLTIRIFKNLEIKHIQKIQFFQSRKILTGTRR